MAQLKTDPAVKGLAPLKGLNKLSGIRNEAISTGESKGFNFIKPNYSSPFRTEDLLKDRNFILPTGLNIKEYNEAVADYGSVAHIDVEDYRARRQSIFETIAKGAGAFVSNALIDTVGIVGLVGGLANAAYTGLHNVITGDDNTFNDYVNMFTAENNSILSFANDMFKLANDNLHIYKTKEDREKVLPFTMGTAMEAFAQLGHTVPQLAILALTGGSGVPLVAALSGFNEAQMEANSTREEINRTRDERNYQTLLETMDAKDKAVAPLMAQFEKNFIENDNKAIKMGLLDPNDTRTQRERLAEAKSKYLQDLYNNDGRVRSAYDTLDNAKDDIISKTTQGYKKYADDAVNTQFLAEGIALSALETVSVGMLSNASRVGRGFLGKQANRLLGTQFTKRLEESAAKKLVTNQAKELGKKSIEEVAESALEGVAKKSNKELAWKLAKGVIAPGLSEASQEMLQEGASQAAQGYTENMIDQYIKSQYDFDKVSTWQGVKEAALDGLKGTFSLEGIQQGAIALMSTLIGFSPNFNRRVDPVTGKKKGLWFNYNLWTIAQDIRHEHNEYNNYVDELTQIKDSSKREQLQEAYRHLFAGEGLGKVAAALRSQGRINESEHAEELSVYNFINAAVQLGKTKEAFTILKANDTEISDEDLSAIIDKSTKKEFDINENKEKLSGMYVKDGKKLNETKEGLAEAREIFNKNREKLNNLWNAFDEAKKAVDEKYQGRAYTPQQKSTLTFMHALRNNYVNQLKEDYSSLAGKYNIEDRIKAINEEVAKLEEEQQQYILTDNDKESEELSSKERLRLSRIKELQEARNSLEEVDNLLSKGKKIDAENLSKKTIDRVNKIVESELAINPQNEAALNVGQSLYELQKINSIIAQESNPKGGFVQKKIDEYNKKAMAEVNSEITATINKDSVEEIAKDIQDIQDRIFENSYSSEYQRERDLYNLEKLYERLEKTKPEVLASALTSQLYHNLGKGWVNHYRENGNENLANALEEYLSDKSKYNLGEILVDENENTLADIAQRHNLSQEEYNDLKFVAINLATRAKLQYQQKLSYMKLGRVATEEEWKKAPVPDRDTFKKKEEKKEERKESKSKDKEGETDNTNERPSRKPDGKKEVVLVDEEGNEIEVEIDEHGGEVLEQTRIETPKIDTLPNPQSSEAEAVEGKLDETIIPATSEHDKQTYNDEHGSYVPANEAAKEKNLSQDIIDIIDLTYKELQDSGAFEYLNSGKLKAGDEIVYGIDPEFEKKKEGLIPESSLYSKPTVFIYKKNADGTLQKLGELFTSDENRKANNSIRTLVTEEYNKSDKNQLVSIDKNSVNDELKEYFEVSEVTGGIIRYTEEYAPISFDTSTVHLAINSGGTLITREGLDSNILIRGETLLNTKGATFILLPDHKGEYHPAFVKFPSLNEGLDTLPNTNPALDVKETLQKIARVHLDENGNLRDEKEVKESLKYLTEQLFKYIHIGNDSYLVYKNDERGPRILLASIEKTKGGAIKVKNVYDKDGNLIRKKYNINYKELNITNLSPEEIEKGLRDLLKDSIFYPNPNSIKSDVSGRYSSDMLSIASTNISNPQLGSVFFTVGKPIGGPSARNVGNIKKLELPEDSSKNKEFAKEWIKQLEESSNGNIKYNEKTNTLEFESIEDFTLFNLEGPVEIFGKEFSDVKTAFAYAKALFFSDESLQNQILNESFNGDYALDLAKKLDSQEYNQVKNDIEAIIVHRLLTQTFGDIENSNIENAQILKILNDLGVKFSFGEDSLSNAVAGGIKLAFSENYKISEKTKEAFYDNGVLKGETEESYSALGTNDPLPTAPETYTPEEPATPTTSNSEETNPTEVDIELTKPKTPTEKETNPDKSSQSGNIVEGLPIDDPLGEEFDDGSDDNDSNRSFVEGSQDLPIDLEIESNWAKNSLGWRLGKQVIQQETVTDRKGNKVQGLYRHKDGRIYVSAEATRNTLFHEAFHKIFNELLHSKDRRVLLNFFNSQSFLQYKDAILGDIIDDVFKKDAEEILAELFSQYVGAGTYGDRAKMKKIMFTLRKIESQMQFSELVNAIENNKPVKYRTVQSARNEAKLRGKNWLSRLFIKMVNLFRSKTKSYRRSDGYLPVASLFRAINNGEFNKYKVEESKSKENESSNKEETSEEDDIDEEPILEIPIDEEEREEIENDLETINSKIETLEKEIEEEKKKAQELHSEFESLFKEAEETKTNLIVDIDKEIAELRKIDTSEFSEEQKEEHNNKIKELDDKANEIVKEREELRAKRSVIYNEWNKISSSAYFKENVELPKLKESKDLLLESLSENKEFKELREEVKTYQKELSEASSEVRDIQTEIGKSKSSILFNKRSIDNIKEGKDISDNRSLEEIEKEQEELEEKINKLKADLDEALVKESNVRNKLEDLTKKLEEKRNEIELKLEENLLNKDNSEVDSRDVGIALEELFGDNSEQKQLNQKISELTEKLNRIYTILNTYSDERIELSDEDLGILKEALEIKNSLLDNDAYKDNILIKEYYDKLTNVLDAINSKISKSEEVKDTDKKQTKKEESFNKVSSNSSLFINLINALPEELRDSYLYTFNALNEYSKIPFLNEYREKLDNLYKKYFNDDGVFSSSVTLRDFTTFLDKAITLLQKEIAKKYPGYTQHLVLDLSENIVESLSPVDLIRYSKGNKYKYLNNIAGRMISQLKALQENMHTSNSNFGNVNLFDLKLSEIEKQCG